MKKYYCYYNHKDGKYYVEDSYPSKKHYDTKKVEEDEPIVTNMNVDEFEEEQEEKGKKGKCKKDRKCKCKKKRKDKCKKSY
ncbi:hypothetical protein FZC66_11435 [Priestia megaterium]|nr:hypothetical protein FZC66_11435 [Priestia megaterium]